MNIRISENIAFLRKEKKITQEELANTLNVSNQAVSKWEAGKCFPDIELLPDLACFFGVSIDELLVGECLIATKPADEANDPIVLQALKIAQENKWISTSVLQRKFGVGYGKAKEIIDDMCKGGYIVKRTDTSGNIYTINHNLELENLPGNSEKIRYMKIDDNDVKEIIF